MGSSSSKISRGATRKYPAAPSATATKARVAPEASNAAPTLSRQGPKEENMDDASRTSGMDPDTATSDFSQRLQQMGVVQPNPTYSPSSRADVQSPAGIPNQTIGAPQFPPKRANPTLSALEARRQLQRQAEKEFENMGLAGSSGRRLVDIRTLVDALQLLNRGWPQADVENRLQLEVGLLDKLGGSNILTHETVAYDPHANLASLSKSR